MDAPDPIAEHRRLVADLVRAELWLERCRRKVEQHEARMRVAAGSRWDVSVELNETRAAAARRRAARAAPAATPMRSRPAAFRT